VEQTHCNGAGGIFAHAEAKKDFTRQKVMAISFRSSRRKEDKKKRA